MIKLNDKIDISGYWRGLHAPKMPKNIANIPFCDKLEAVIRNYPSYDKSMDIIESKSKFNSLLKRGALAGGKRYAFTNDEIRFYLNYTGIKRKIDHFDKDQQKAFEELRSLRKKKLFEMLINGASGFEYDEVFRKNNTATLLYTDTLQDLFDGTATVNQTGEALEVAVGASYDPPTSSDTALGNQIGSNKAYDEIIRVGLTTTLITDFRTTDNNGLDTTITTPITSSSVFTLTSVTGLQVGDAVQGTTTSGEKKTVITNISGSQVTVSPALLDTPSNGDRFLQIWGEGGIYGNNAGADLFTHARFSDDGYEKDNTRAIIVESSMVWRIV